MERVSGPLVLTADQARAAPRDALGGKAAPLLGLRALGLEVPRFLVVPAGVFARLREPWDARLARLRPDTPDAELEALAAAIRGRWSEVPLPELTDALAEALARHFPDDPALAVRSSAADEDGVRHSFAGIHESELQVRGVADVIAALRRVWASAVSPRALRYRLAHGLPCHGIRLAVVLQELVDAEVSGVLFTADPADGDVHRCTISALYGLGEGLVSRGLDADLYRVDKHDGTVEAAPVGKEWRIVADRVTGRGVRQEPVPAEWRERPCLSAARLRALADVGALVERAAGRPQDLEFCYDAAGRLFLLQSRAITTAPEYGPAAGNPILWDNSNIVESYAGVTTPLTFAFIRQAYAAVYRSFAAFMGVPRRVIHAESGLFECMLGLIRGRVYYNLRHWYRLVKLFPAYRFNRRFLESMMGVSEELRDEAPAPRPGFLRRWLVEAPRTAWLLCRAAWAFGRLDSLVRRFERRFEDLDRRWAAVDVSALDPAGCHAFYRDMEANLLQQWRVPIINDFHVMVFHGLLRRLSERWLGPDQVGLHHALLCHTGGLRSAEPVQRLDALAARARRSPALVRRITAAAGTAEADSWLDPNGPDPEFVTAVHEYLAAFGDRCADELKLESRTLREDPEPLRGMLARCLAGPVARAAAPAPGADAGSRARGLLLRHPLGWLRYPVFCAVLRAARRGIRHRESLRLLRTRAFGRVRSVARRLGAWLADEGLLARADDVFFLTLEEVFALLHGTAVTTDLAGLVDVRRREFAAHQQAAPPADRFPTFGLVHHRNACRPRRRPVAADADGALVGVPCCPGRVTARTRLVRDPRAPGELAGRILVAERTDPGWVPLFPFVAGLLVQRGSVLSHSAIVARELGIPTIVGIRDLTQELADDEEVSMDGARGTVERTAPRRPEDVGADLQPSADRSSGARIWMTTGAASRVSGRPSTSTDGRQNSR